MNNSALIDRIWHIPAAGSSTATRTHSVVTSALLAAVTSFALVAPWIVHLAPADGGPLGPKLLPMFYAPVLAALLLRLPIAVALSAATPFVSRALTGMPPDPVLTGMLVQVTAFVLIIRLARRYHWALVVPAAFIMATAAAAVITAAAPGVATISLVGSLETGWPGVLVLTGLGWAAHETLR